MEQTSILVAPPGDLARQQHTHAPIRIMRGVSAALAMDPAHAGPWDIWDAIALARMHAVNVSHRQPPYLRWAKLPATDGDTRLVSKSSHHNFSRQSTKHLCLTFLHCCVHDCPRDVCLVFPVATAIGRARHY